MSKLKMLQPRLKAIDPHANIKMLDTRPPLQVADIRTQRWTKANNGRLLPLNSEAWRKLRAHVLAGEPLCRHCTARGLTVPATEIDHRDNNPANNDPVNLCPLCRPCHSRKTAKDMGHNVRMGCDAQGKPLDPGHHWNNPASAVLTSRDATAGEISPATKDAEPTGYPHVIANCKGVV